MSLNPLHIKPGARQLVAVALLALLLAQGMAAWHAVSHAPGLLKGQAHHATATATPAQTADAHAHDAAGHQAGSPVCQLFDQLLLGHVPSHDFAAVGNAAWGSQLPQAQPDSSTPSTALQAYDARGPPRA